MHRILLALLILLAFLSVTFLPVSFNSCFFGSCGVGNTNNPVICASGICFGENMIQYLSKKTQFLNASVNFKLVIVFTILLILFFSAQKQQKDEKALITKLYTEQELFKAFHLKTFDYLIRAFSIGVTNPQIY